MDAPNHYELLCVTSDATDEQIRASYRKLIRIYHPDVSGAAGATMTRRLNRAEADLLDPVRRAQYDQTLGVAGFPRARGGSFTSSGSSSRQSAQTSSSASDSSSWGPSSSSMPPSGRPRTNEKNSPAAGRTRGKRTRDRRHVVWSANRYVAWLSVVAVTVGVILGGTAIVFTNVYSGPMSTLSPGLVPAFIVALAWIVAALGRAPLILIGLLVLGAATWSLAAFGFGPLSSLCAGLPPVVVVLPTVIVLAVLALKIAAPRARALSRARPTTQRSRFGTAPSH